MKDTAAAQWHACAAPQSRSHVWACQLLHSLPLHSAPIVQQQQAASSKPAGGASRTAAYSFIRVRNEAVPAAGGSGTAPAPAAVHPLGSDAVDCYRDAPRLALGLRMSTARSSRAVRAAQGFAGSPSAAGGLFPGSRCSPARTASSRPRKNESRWPISSSTCAAD